jgi:hypothetical protein
MLVYTSNLNTILIYNLTDYTLALTINFANTITNVLLIVETNMIFVGASTGVYVHYIYYAY